MNLNLIISLLVVYVVYLLSTFSHELSHKRKAKKYNITILKSRKEVIKNNLEKELSKYSFFIFEFEFKFFGALLHFKEEEIKKLDFSKQKEILLAGIKSDITLSILLIFLFFLLPNLDFFNITKIITKELNFVISCSLLIILGKTYENIFDPFNKGGDVTKLLVLRGKIAKT